MSRKTTNPKRRVTRKFNREGEPFTRTALDLEKGFIQAIFTEDNTTPYYLIFKVYNEEYLKLCKKYNKPGATFTPDPDQFSLKFAPLEGPFAKAVA